MRTCLIAWAGSRLDLYSRWDVMFKPEIFLVCSMLATLAGREIGWYISRSIF